MQTKIYVRSLFLQGAWDYERMQGLGFAWALSPWLKRLYVKNKPALQKAYRRQIECFNTQPYMAGVVLGVVAKMEESAAQRLDGDNESRILQVKRSMGATMAAIGDPIFWGAWRPLCAVAAIIFALALPVSHSRAVLFGVIAYLILYNVPATKLRWSGIRWGYESGEQIAERLKRLRFHKSLARTRLLGLALAILLALYAIWRAGEQGFWPATMRVGLLSLCLAFRWAGWNVVKAYSALIVLGIALAGITAAWSLS